MFGRQDSYIITTKGRHRFLSGPYFADEPHRAVGVRVSGQTVRNHLHASRLNPRLPVFVMRLTQRHRRFTRQCTPMQCYVNTI